MLELWTNPSKMRCEDIKITYDSLATDNLLTVYASSLNDRTLRHVFDAVNCIK
jgi:hypothetical protein